MVPLQRALEPLLLKKGGGDEMGNWVSSKGCQTVRAAEVVSAVGVDRLARLVASMPNKK